MGGPFSIEFAYARYEATSAPRRDVGKLGGGKHLRSPQPELARRAGGWNASIVDLPRVNFQGADLKGLPRVPSARECRRACAREPRCMAFTFILSDAPRSRTWRPCWLKGGGFHLVPTRSESTVSGVVREWERGPPRV